MKILLTYGKQDFLDISKKFKGEALEVSNAVIGLLERGKYLYDVCNDQEVYQANQSDLEEYQKLALQVKDWFFLGDKDMDKYYFVRHVKFW